ncbi:F0F1 ATP synthase subunit B' [Phormidium yuhuli AB48]|uniref:ATP synthase subunit b' n=2 Tax=Phormidium TaxID=1198 RepID=A0ABY5AV77_9CYAN|nr:F0F1 ATP synthase subunit B' [Phormidium yuhuli AB48]
MMHWTIVLATEATQEGGLFSFDATLPLMAVQFMVLVGVLNAVFYKPLSKSLDDRDDYIRTKNQSAQARLKEVQDKQAKYEQELASSRQKAQEIINAARAQANRTADAEIAEAQRQANEEREQAAAEIEQQKQAAFAQIDQQVSALSRQILEKILGSELVQR